MKDCVLERPGIGVFLKFAARPREGSDGFSLRGERTVFCTMMFPITQEDHIWWNDVMLNLKVKLR